MEFNKDLGLAVFLEKILVKEYLDFANFFAEFKRMNFLQGFEIIIFPVNFYFIFLWLKTLQIIDLFMVLKSFLCFIFQNLQMFSFYLYSN